jgi:O-antigen/teichoic acid export membrane protein
MRLPVVTAPGAAGGRLRRRITRVAGGAASTGLLMLAMSMCAHVGNYLYYVVALRILGPADYAQLSVVTALGNIAFVPFTGVQAAVAREVAASRVQGRDGEAGATVRWMVERVFLTQLGLFAVLAALWPVAEAVWSLSSWWIWFAGVCWLTLGLAMQSWQGVIQGLQRFRLFGSVLAGPQGMLRLLFLVPLALVWGVVGALWALVAATVIGLAMMAPSVRLQLAASREPGPVAGHGPRHGPRHGPGHRPVARRRVPQLALAVVALLALGSLVNVDVPVVKAFMADVDAGHYAAASLLAKIAYYAPAVLAMMLLPSVTARLAEGRPVAGRILATLGATAGTGLLVLLALLIAPRSIVTLVFGADFAGVYGVALALTAVMTCAATVNVHLMVALATRERRFVYLLVGGAALQLALLVTLGSTFAGAVTASAVAFVALLICYEAASPYGAVRLLLTWRQEHKDRKDRKENA